MEDYAFYSRELKKVFNTLDELKAAEAEALTEKNARKEAAAKVKAASEAADLAYDAYVKAVDEYNKELKEFCSTYGAYKTSVKSSDIRHIDPFMSLFNFSFRDF